MQEMWESLTTRGTAFVAAGVCLTLSGMALGQRDLTRVGLLLLTLVLVSVALLRRHGGGLTVHRTLQPPHAAMDDQVVVNLELRNTGRRASGVIFGDEQLDFHLGDRPRFVIPALRPGSTCSLQYRIRPSVRGVHALGPVGARVKDVFGLTLRTAEVGESSELLVVPRVISLEGTPSGSVGLGSDGAGAAVVALHGEDDQGIREYRNGDDLRRIHWPASARTGELMVRQEDRPLRRQALVLLDTRASRHSGTGRSSTLEWAVTMTASVAAHLASLGYAVTTVIPQPSSPSGVTVAEDQTATLVALARALPTADKSLSDLLHAARALTRAGGLVVHLGGAPTENDALPVAALRQPGSAGIALLADPISTPGTGPRARTQLLAGVSVLDAAGFRTALVVPSTPPPEAWGQVSGRLVRSGR